jgi:hypothetical protein
MLQILFLTFGILNSQATADTRFVAKTGSDANSCEAAKNINTPKLTIASGLSCTNSGDTLSIRAGTYNEGIHSAQIKSGSGIGNSYTNPTIIQAHNGELVKLIGVAPGGAIFNMTTNDFQYVIFKDLELDASISLVSDLISFTSYTGPGAHHIKFDNIHAHHAGGNVVHIGETLPGGTMAHDIWFKGGRYHDAALKDPYSASGHTYPFYVGGNNHIIEDAEIYHTKRYCIHLWTQDPNLGARGIIIRNNRIHDCDTWVLTDPIYASDTAIIIGHADSTLVYNNLIYNNYGGGISVYGSLGNKNAIYNNTIYKTGASCIQNSSSFSAIAQNNICYLTTGLGNAGTLIGSNLVNVNPLFVNPTAGDFHLQSTSPAINTATPVSIVTTDFDRNARPQGGAYDFGAYEFLSGAASPRPPMNLKVY